MRILFVAVSCLAALTLAMTESLTIAQQRRGEASSQRVLPLPQRELSDSETQMQLLKRLRSLVTSTDEPANESTPDDDES